MNYTENYHLPQWVKDDRIMMEDFNQMCADLEAGMTENAQAAADVRKNDKKTSNRLLRLAYNHFCAVQELDGFPHQDGVFLQDFEKDSSGLTGATRLNGKLFAGKFSENLTPGVISYQVLENMHFDKNNLASATPLKGILKAPASGYVKDWVLGVSFKNSAAGANFRVRFSVFNRETGGLEQTFVTTFTNRNDNGAAVYQAVDPIYFVGGVEYLIVGEALDAVCDMAQAQISIAGSMWANTQAVQCQDTITASRTFLGTGGGDTGIAVLRCAIGGEGGTMRFLWDGVEREPVAVQTVNTGNGRGFREYVFLRDEPIPEDSSLSLRFVCNEEGSFMIHSWGMMVI